MTKLISSTFGFIPLLSCIAIALPSCNVPNPAYCAFADGNRSCDVGSFCILYNPNPEDPNSLPSKMGVPLTSEQKRGCFESYPIVTQDNQTMVVPEDYCCADGPIQVTNRDWRRFLKGEINCADLIGIPILDPECTKNTGDTTSTTIGGATASGTETMTGPGTGTESSSSDSTAGGHCEMSRDCIDQGRPICLDGKCVPCNDLDDDGIVDSEPGDSACAMAASETDPLVSGPACSSSGQCVFCTDTNADECPTTTPICDSSGAVPTCICTTHRQCLGEAVDGNYPGAACHIDEGSCFPEGSVINVGGGTDSIADLPTAIGMIEPNTPTTVILYGNQSVSVLIDEGQVVAIIGAPLLRPTWTSLSDATLNVNGSGTIVYLQHLQIIDHPISVAVQVSDSRLRIDETAIVGNDLGGIVASGAADLEIWNSMLGGVDGNLGTAVLDSQGATVSVYYSTIISGGTFNSVPIRCDPTRLPHIENSILLDGDEGFDFDCRGLLPTLANTVIESDLTEAYDPPYPDWFTNNEDDFHLTGPVVPSSFGSSGSWIEGYPTTDYDGIPGVRPSGVKNQDYVGADVP